MVFVSTPFRKLAESRREALGMPELEPAMIPHPLATMTAERIAEVAQDVASQVTKILTGAR